MFKQQEFKVFWEVLKDFARWALSFFIGWIIDNGYSFFAKSKLDPQLIIAISITFKYADYYWHKHNKELKPRAGTITKTMGIIPF
ncbi:MAG: hypothetical protein AAB922_00780 [Patescibacteria group bacterium]